MPEGKEKTLRRLRPSNRRSADEQLKICVFQPFLSGEGNGEEIACKYKLV